MSASEGHATAPPPEPVAQLPASHNVAKRPLAKSPGRALKAPGANPSGPKGSASMTIHTLNPLHDSRWREFLSANPHSSVFHGLGWLNALHRTYSYEPVVYTTSQPGAPLDNGILFCRISSWL